MLGDNSEKSKNPLKKAMRRRNAKTVQFTAPTYYEPSDYEWSDEEDEDDDSQLGSTEIGAQTDDGESQQEQRVEPATVVVDEQQLTNGVDKPEAGQLSPVTPSSPIKMSSDAQQSEDSIQRSRKGVVRNTDSFFKDDTVETKKISLTPRLLRGDSAQDVLVEEARRPSLETFDKMIAADDKPKEDHKKKEKKGMLSGLFKRKDKDGKPGKNQISSEKVSEESLRQSTQSKESLESISNRTGIEPERKPSKLQKAPPQSMSPKSIPPTEVRAPQRDAPPQEQTISAPIGPARAPPTLRAVYPEPQQELTNSVNTASPTQGPSRFPSLTEKKSNFTPVTTVVSPSSTVNDEPVGKPVYSARPKNRFAVEESDSEDEQTPTQSVLRGGSVSPLRETPTPSHSRTDSGMQVSPVKPTKRNLPPVNTAVKAEEAPIENHTPSTSKASPSFLHTPSTSRSTPTWSDASLRSYMDNDQETKDLLIIVHDKSNVTPVGPDHPLMSGLFTEERTKLAEMQSQLDSMLTSWLARKNTSVLSR